MAFLETITLGFGGNLIIGNSTDKITLDMMAKKLIGDQQKLNDIESFGLFDTNQPNFNTYYPDVTANDLNPKDEEFIQPIFRALSEVIVHKNWNPVDFTMNGVLKKSMSLLKGATINADHEVSTGNALGAVKSVSWQDSYKMGEIVIPAGINAKMKIDGKSHPRVARAINMDPPAIHSTSVTIQFEWAKSHPSMSDNDFFSKSGSFDKDGTLIRRIAENIKKYPELSLVHHGADPYAQLVKENGINNPLYADVSYNSVKPEQKQKQFFYFFDFKTDIIKNEEKRTIPENSNNNNSHQTSLAMKKIWITLAALMAVKFVDPENPTDQEMADLESKITGAINANNAAQLTITNNTTEINRLLLVETAYNADKANLTNATALQAFKDKETTALRAKVLANQTILSKGTPEKTILDMITNASYETLAALDSTLTTQLEEKFPISCKKCGSTEVNRSSAIPNNPDEHEEPLGDALTKLLKEKQGDGAFQIHGKAVLPA